MKTYSFSYIQKLSGKPLFIYLSIYLTETPPILRGS